MHLDGWTSGATSAHSDAGVVDIKNHFYVLDFVLFVISCFFPPLISNILQSSEKAVISSAQSESERFTFN